MSTFVLDRAYLVEEETGIARHRVVVAGSSPSHCRLPDGANAGRVLGVTTQSQEREGRAIPVRRFGYTPCEAAESFNAGDPVCVADDGGRVRAVRPPHALVGTEDVNGAVRFVSRFPAERHFLSGIEISASGSESPLASDVADGVVMFALETDAISTPVTTAAQLATYVNTHPLLSKLVKAEVAGGDGSAVAEAGSPSFTAHEESIHVVGIAQDDSSGEGDIVDVLLLPA